MSYPGPGNAGGVISPGNGTAVPLGGGATFTGAWEEITDYGSISVITIVTLPAATGTLNVDFSTDGGATTARTVSVPIVSAGIHSFIPVSSHLRVRYVNDGVAQTSFQLQTIYNSSSRIAQPTSRLDQSLTSTVDVLNVRSAVVGQDAGGTYRNVEVDENGFLSVDIAAPRSAFGEVQVAEPDPFVQLKFTNGITSDTMREEVSESATITESGGLAVVGTGATAGSVSRLTSTRYARYAPGQGIEARYTAVFTAGSAGTSQWAGMGDAEAALAFGLDEEDFAILRRTGGQVEIRTLTVTGASTGPGTITITLNGGAGVAVAIGGVLTIGAVAAAIAAADYSSEGGGFRAIYAGNRVIFKSLTAESRGGAYSFAAGATGATGAFAATKTGAVATEDIIPSTAWNGDPADGTDILPLIDPTLGNVYRIAYQWLGFGAIFFAIENPPSGRFIQVHRIQYANSSAVPTLRQPDMPVMLEADNQATTDDKVIRSASMSVFNLGQRKTSGPIHSPGATRNIGTSFTVLLAIRLKSLNLAGVTNKIDTLVQSISYGNAGGKPAQFRVWRNPTIVGSPTWTNVDANNSTLEISVNGTTVSGGELFLSTLVGAGGGQTIVFSQDDPFVIRPDTLYVIDAALLSGAADDLAVSLRVVEDV